MLRENITYTDYDGNTRTEEFYFNFTKAELIEMEYTTEGGFMNTCREILDSNDRVEIFNMFKWLLLKSVGKKSEDGRKFIKNDLITRDFEECPAYNELFVKLLNDEEYCVRFITAILPNDLSVASSDAKAENLVQLT